MSERKSQNGFKGGCVETTNKRSCYCLHSISQDAQNLLDFGMPKMLSIFVHSCRAENKEHYLKPKMPEIKSSGNSVFVVLFSTKEKFEKEKMKYVMSERQKKALQYANEHGKITNSEFRKLFPDITDRTALNDLTDLVSKKILAKKGKTKSAYYIIPK